MPRLTMLVSLVITAILCGSIFASDTQPTIQSLNKMPLSFTKNMGQWDDRVLFRANSGGATMWFTKEGVTYQFTRRIDSPDDRGGTLHVPAGTRSVPLPEGLDSRLRGNDMERDSVEQLVLTAKFLGANPNPEVFAEGLMEYKCNYFLGNDPAKWYTDVPNFEAITLKDLYPGIDLKYSGRRGNGQAAYEFIAAPGADIAQIKVAYEGAEETSLDSDGKLILKTKWGDITAGMNSPRLVGEGSGVRAVLSGSTSCAWWTSSSTTSPPSLSNGDVRQALAGSSGTLTLSYSTYLGGGGDDAGFDIAIDRNGNAYVTGMTYSTNFPILNPYQPDPDPAPLGDDVFVTKLSNSGNTLIYSTYLGGTGGDQGFGIAVDDSGHAYVTGSTSSVDFPTQNPYRTGGGVFVTKLSSSGDSLIFSTCIGSGYALDIAVDATGNAYVTGGTLSSDFPTLNAFQPTFLGPDGRTDAFVSKLSNTGSSLVYSTFLGGGGESDEGSAITVDGSGFAYVTGATRSSDFPILAPFQTDQAGADAFVVKLSRSGDSLVYGTYLGGGGDDYGNGIAVDRSHNVYVTGSTSSSDFPTVGPYQAHHEMGYATAFVTKLLSDGNSLIYSTYLGGGTGDWARGIAVDGSGNAYVTGSTQSSDFPILNPYQTDQGREDVFLAKLCGVGNSLIYSTYLGGRRHDWGSGIAIDAIGNAYVAGWTESSDFPTRNALQPTYQGGSYDGLVAKLTWTPAYPCGDVNTDEQINLLDAVFLINYIFIGGPAPQLLSLADVNCSGGTINIGDVVLMINYIFRSGPAPCAECE